MATNVRNQPTPDPAFRDTMQDEINDEIHGEPHVGDTTPRVRPAGGSGVSVYDRNPAQPIDPALRPASPASLADTTPVSGRVPVEPRSTGSIVGWLIGAVLLIVIAYFLLQLFF